MIRLDLKIGDTILTGKWKNKKVVIKKIGTDEFGNPTVNDKSILKIRIPKLYKESFKIGSNMKKKSMKMKDIFYKNPPPPPLNEGLVQNAIAGILKLVYSGKINDLKKKIAPTNKELAQSLDSLNKNIQKFNSMLDDPETIEAFKSAGVDITQWPKYKR